MANPQCVALVKELPDRARFERLGPALATHARFAAGTNVEFAVVEAPESRAHPDLGARRRSDPRLRDRRVRVGGGGRDRAGGAARDIEVNAPGGTQRVEWRDDGVYLTGWAEVVFDGQWVPR